MTGDVTRFVERAGGLAMQACGRGRRFTDTYGLWGLAAVCSVIASFAAAPPRPGLMGGALAVTMIAIAAIDARSFTIPDKLTVSGVLLGFVNVLFAHQDQFAAALAHAVLRGGVLAFIFLGARMMYRRIRKREGIGLGDVKLVAVAGVWLDWTSFSVAVDLAALSALAAVLIQSLRGRRFTGVSAIPFGLFFAPAIWLAWLLEAIGARLTS